MKTFVILVCFLVGTTMASPIEVAPGGLLDILDKIKHLKETVGELLRTVSAKLQEVLEKLRGMIPDDSILHDRINNLIDQLKALIQKIEKQFKIEESQMPGFDPLDFLGEDLGTVLKLFRLAREARQVITEALKMFPGLEGHLMSLKQMIKNNLFLFEDLLHKIGITDDWLIKLGLKDKNDEKSSQSQSVWDEIKREVRVMIDLVLISINDCVGKVEEIIPEAEVKIKEFIREIKKDIEEFIRHLNESIGVVHSISIMDLLEELSGKVSMDTMFKLMEIVYKVEKLVSDTKDIVPEFEKILDDAKNDMTESLKDCLKQMIEIIKNKNKY